jgi:hypothetical protein
VDPLLPASAGAAATVTLAADLVVPGVTVTALNEPHDATSRPGVAALASGGCCDVSPEHALMVGQN